MKRWLMLLPISIIFMLSFASPLAAQVTSLRVTITNVEEDKVAPGSTFTVNFTLTVPDNLKDLIPTGGKLYAYTFYFVGDEPQYANVPYWDVSGGEATYIQGTTNYSLKIKIMDTAPVGQKIFVAIGWYNTLDSNWAYSSADNTVTVVIGGTTFTYPVANVKVYTDETRYYVVDQSGWDVYVRTTYNTRLYVTGSQSNVEIKAAPGLGLPIEAIIGGVVVLIVVVVAVILVKRRGRGEIPPVPEMAPPPPPEAPPAPPEFPPATP